MRKQIGFIGIGEMGFPMVSNLLKSGYAVAAFDLRSEPLLAIEKKGARIAKSPQEVAQSSQVVICMVLTTDQVVNVLQGEKGVFEGAAPGTIVLIMSTIDPMVVKKLSITADSRGIRLLDAPVSGAKEGAEAGNLSIMVGGPETAFEECRPVLETLGKSIFYLGEAGMGEVAKLVNNHLLLVNMLAVYEAMSLAQVAGIRTDLLLELIKRSTGNSWVMEHWDLVKSWKQESESQEMGAAKFRDIKTLYKDIQMTLNFAKELKVPLKLAGLSSQLGWD
jgi:3-hydroxyisobutyrate dehydrogenase-like beta-hydroxyacid dehydrogenase